MPHYVATQDYRTDRHALDKGQTVDLSEADAEHIERDAPGTLKLGGKKQEAQTSALPHPSRDRQVKRGD